MIRTTTALRKATRRLPILALAPVVIIPFSRHFENERPTLRSLLGGAIAVTGVIGLRFSLN